MRQKGFVHLLLPITLFTIALAVIGYFVYRNSQAEESNQSTQETTNSDGADLTETSDVSNPSETESVYVSQNLGIKFTYPTITDTVYKWPISITESGNRIQFWYKHPDQQEKTASVYVEVFEKDPNYNLKTAIEKKLLNNYSLNDCLVETYDQSPIANASVPGSIYAKIVTPNHKNLLKNVDMTVIFEEAKKCPADYVSTNYVNYFYYNPKHPNTFLYLSLGQSGSMSLQNGKQWYQTIEFIN